MFSPEDFYVLFPKEFSKSETGVKFRDALCVRIAARANEILAERNPKQKEIAHV